MKLSIVLISNHTFASLQQALNSLTKACTNIDYELIIVDNSTTGSSVESIETTFAELKVIHTAPDAGIAKAANQAIKQCRGEYILLVDADTICAKDSLDKICAFMDEHPDAGGVGVRMLSTEGRFLPESIHGLTMPWAVFFKLIGFAKHLSKTRLYDRNRKDWVEEFQITEIDIVNSSFMLLRSSVLNETGLFDERFVMFGHNIDLSYRIRLAGFKNYYFPKTYIIHSESNSLAKFSWSYIKYFYGAMLIFAMKYLFRLPEIKVQGLPQVVSTVFDVK